MKASKKRRHRKLRRPFSARPYSIERIFFAMMPPSIEASLAHQYDAIVATLRAERNKAGLTQEQLEARIGLAKGHIEKLERKERLARGDMLLLWAYALGFDIKIEPRQPQ